MHIISPSSHLSYAAFEPGSSFAVAAGVFTTNEKSLSDAGFSRLMITRPAASGSFPPSFSASSPPSYLRGTRRAGVRGGRGRGRGGNGGGRTSRGVPAV